MLKRNLKNNLMDRQAVVILGLRKQALPIVRAIAQVSYLDLYCFIDSRKPKEEVAYTRYGMKVMFSSSLDLQTKLERIQESYTPKLNVFIIAAYLLTEIRECYSSIYDRYNVFSSPLEWINIFTDKYQMYSWVQQYGIETVPAVPLLQYKPGCLKFPLVLKRNIEHVLSFKIKILYNQNEFDSFVSAMPDNASHVIVQELVQGMKEKDLSYQGYLFQGRVKGRIVLEEVRHFPEGISCYLQELEGNLMKRVVASSETFLLETKYSGFIQIDYKYLETEDRLIIMDINARTPASHSAFSHKFINYNQLFTFSDEPPMLCPKKGLIKWVNVVSDIVCNIKKKEYKGLFEIIFAKWDIWSWRDPFPFCISVLQLFSNGLKCLCLKMR